MPSDGDSAEYSRANLPVFEALYKSVKDGSETRRSLDFNSRKTYRQDLQKELDEIDNQEIWRAGKTVRALRVSLLRLKRVKGVADDAARRPKGRDLSVSWDFEMILDMHGVMPSRVIVDPV